MRCPSCSADIPCAAKFCPECGHRLGVATKGAPAANAATPVVSPDVSAAVDRVFSRYHDVDANCRNVSKGDAHLVAEAARGGDARAMFLLGRIYLDGCDGWDKNEKKALDWYRKSAEAGDPWGMAAYGLSLAESASEDPDWDGMVDADALVWISKATIPLMDGTNLTALALLVEMFVHTTFADKTFFFDITDEMESTSVDGANNLIEGVEKADPDQVSAVVRKAVGDAFFILAMAAMRKGDFESMMNRLSQGYDKVTRPESGLFKSTLLYSAITDRTVWKDGHHAQTGNSSSIVVRTWHTSWRIMSDGWRGRQAEILDLNIGTLTPWPTGDLKLMLWCCNSEFNGRGPLDGFLVAEAEIGRLVGGIELGGAKVIYDSVRGKWNILGNMRIPITGNPPTGDYLGVIIVTECHQDGNWYQVGYATLPNRNSWLRQ